MSQYVTSTRAALAAVILFALSTPLPAKRIFMHEDGRAIISTPEPMLAVGPQIIINEVDSDTPGADAAEFVELFDGGAGNTPLDGHVVVFFNGGAVNDASYAAFDLDGFTTNANGFFTLGNAAVPGVDLIFANGLLQNGPDAVALFLANASDFPNGTPITTVNIRDALVYNNGVTIDAGLLVLLNAGQLQVNENSGGTGSAVSMQRIPNGSGGERNTVSYQVFAPTPDGLNVSPTAAQVSLSGRVTDAGGRGIRNAIIAIEGGGLTEPRVVATGSMGYYNVEDLAIGTYIVTVQAKRHSFANPTRSLSMSDNVADFDFIAEP